jgi:NADH-quinone oxidoreductase subunit A
MYSEYSLLIFYLIISLAVISLLFFGSLFLVYQQPLVEKNSSYECGFNAFLDARAQFDVRFYIVGLLFLIFDLELIFLFLLIIGFLYEIDSGCLS